jgi:hypothetical protein
MAAKKKTTTAGTKRVDLSKTKTAQRDPIENFAPTGRRSRRPKGETSGNSSIAKVVDQMSHVAKSTVAGAGGFSTNPGSMRPQLGTFAGLDPEARNIERKPRKDDKPAPKSRRGKKK